MATKDTGGGQQKATHSTEEVEEQAQDAQATDDLKERQEKLSGRCRLGSGRNR